MPRVSLNASKEHYLEHLAPIWRALPEERRGQVRVLSHALELTAHRLSLGPVTRGALGEDAVLAAGWVDTVGHLGPVGLLEHGAGQSYVRDDGTVHQSYSGGRDREHIGLFLCPSISVARRNAAVYPNATVEVVGCPLLDQWHSGDQPVAESGRVVAMTWHWPAGIVPESRWALPHYRAHLPELVRWANTAGVTLVGHGHPRVTYRLQSIWKRLGVPWVTHAEVLTMADVLVVDNSSMGLEFASLDKPIVWLSAPWYRRDVHHGGRFWEWVEAGEHVEAPAQLIGATTRALEEPTSHAIERRRVVHSVYAHRDGRCGVRAAHAILEWLER